MTAPARVLDLVDRCYRDLPAYKSGAYNETLARQEFIDPALAPSDGTSATAAVLQWPSVMSFSNTP
jgi:hypothetical protein